MINSAQLTRLAINMDPSIASDIAPLLESEGERCEINTDARIACWMAQIVVECANFGRFSENLNYSAGGLIATWPTHFPPEVAARYARLPEKIANRAYAGRLGNGDEASGDGWRYRGGGFLQITGRANYASASTWTGLDLVGNPDQLRSAGLPAARAAAAFWRVHTLNAMADTGDFVGITRAVNGGLNGLAARLAAWATAQKIWPC